MSFLLKLLQAVASLGPKIPRAIELLNAFYNLFAAEIDKAIPDGLEMTELSPEEAVCVEKISAALSAKGVQAQFDLSRIRRLIKFLSNQGFDLDWLIGVLTRAGG